MSINQNENNLEKKKPSGWHIVSSYVVQNWWVYLAALLLIMVSSKLAVKIPQLIGRFTDQLQHGTLEVQQAAHFAETIMLISFFRVTTVWLGRIIINGHGRILVYQLRKQLLKKWSTLSPSYYQGHSVGDLLSHALSDVEVVRQFASMGISQSINGLSMLTAALYMMAVHMNWHLALAGLGPLIAIPILVGYFGPKIKNQSMHYQSALGSMAQLVEEVIGGIRVVKAFGNEAVTLHRFEEKVEKIVHEKVKFVRLSSLFGSLLPFLSSIGSIVVLSYGGYLTINHTITLGDFAAFFLYLAQLRQPLEQLGQTLNVVQRAAGSLNRISGLLSVVPDVVDDPDAKKEHRVIGNIKVKNLTFRYPGTEKNVLENISFEVEKGKTIGIVGALGSGKSTLTNLLLRLYNPPKGTIFIDGVDILKIPLENLRHGIAYVPQSGFLFSEKILDNIGFSDNSPDLEKAEKAAQSAVVYDNIVEFPDGFNTEIGERGVRLSGGQKQRVAIARMLYKNAPIHILDDSLSAVDTKTERALLHNLRHNSSVKLNSLRRKTTLIISHRLSAVRHADEILVLADGTVSERGTHSHLIHSGGLYSRLWIMQSGTEEEQKVVGVDGNVRYSEPDLSEERNGLPLSLEGEPA
jgi:ATP-binding cassette subfamily B protein